MSTSGASNPRGRGEPPASAGISRHLATIRRHLALIAACVVVTVAAAAVYVHVAPRKYTATAQLLINPASAQNTVVFSLPVLHASSDPVNDMLTAANLITTPQVSDAVIAALHLKVSPSALGSSVQAIPLAQSNILAVQAQGSSALTAQQLANTFAQQVIAVRTKQLHATLNSLIPALKAQVAALPAAQRNGVGSLGDRLAQYQQLRQQNDPTISIAAPAARPAAPSSPRQSLTLAAGALVGLLLGLGAAFGFEAFDPRLQREEQLRELAGRVPILARIPKIARHPARRPMQESELSPAAVEQYRMLQAALSAPPRRESGRGRAAVAPSGQVYLITGSAPAEGKTTSALGLTAVLARSGADVILIEADLRRPTIADTLGLVNFTGAEQVLAGEADLEESLQDVHFGRGRFRVLAAHPHADTAGLLSYASAERLVQEAQRLADHVVIDSPPLTAVIDALPFSLTADHTVVVARLGLTRRSQLADLLDLLDRHNQPPTGIVIVGAPQSEGGLYYYYTEPGPQLGTGDASPPAVLEPSPRRQNRR